MEEENCHYCEGPVDDYEEYGGYCSLYCEVSDDIGPDTSY